MLTSSCSNCYRAKSLEDYDKPLCAECRALGDAAAASLREQFPDATDDQIAYARRTVIASRKGHPWSERVAPNQFGRSLPQAGGGNDGKTQ